MPPQNQGGMLENFLRVAGLYGPQDDTDAYMGMPPELPTRGMAPPLVNRQGPGISVPGAYGAGGPVPDEELIAEVEQPQSTLDVFRQNVLNPPKRTQMTYPKNTLAGLTEALKIAAEPSPLAKNRVWVNGVPHQKQQVRTDPVTGEKQFITNVHEPAFMDQVMRAMPASISATTDILNQPREDAVADWELKNKGLKEAIGAESQMALAGQRAATAASIPQKVAQGERALDIKQMDAETRARVASLKDLPDSEKIRLLQEGKISIAELNASNAIALEGKRQTGRMELEGTRQAGREKLEGIRQRGRVSLQELRSLDAQELEEIRQDNRIEIEGVQGDQARQTAITRAQEARATKATPSGSAGVTGQIPTQQRQAAVNKANEVVNAHPEWKDMITIDPDTKMPVIKPPSDPWFGEPDFTEYDKAYEALYGRKRPGSAGAAAPIAPPAAAPAAKPATATPPAKPTTKPAPTKPAPSPTTGKVRVQAPNGQTGTWDLSKGPIPNGFKKIG